LIAIPTETVYGLAGNAFSEKAINKIFELKKRPHFNPLIVHVKSPNELHSVAREIPEYALKLAEAYWPGPLTLVLKKQSNISSLITAGKDTVAVRVPNHYLTLALLNLIDFPLVAPSANPFGSISPTSAEHVFNYFNDDLEIILDGGACERGIESTIVGFENDIPHIYRLGSVSVEEIQQVIGNVEVFHSETNEIKSPGMLSRHYAPQTKTLLVDDVEKSIKECKEKRIGLLLFKRHINETKIIAQETLSEKGDLNECAQKFYASLHNLDRLNLDIIIAEKFPDLGLGRSINDRLQRATKP
jgi:L-threonylcarbamoyladenylate synthase